MTTRSRLQLLCSVGWGGPSETGWNMDPELASTLRLGGLQGQIRGGEKSLERQSQTNGTVKVYLQPTSRASCPPVPAMGMDPLRRFLMSQPMSGPRPGFYISLFP